MKKKIYKWFVVTVTISIAIILIHRIYSQSGQSNSKKWNNENTQELLEEYENMYNLAFMLATNDVEKELSGIWQVRDVVGYNADTARYQWNGYSGDIVLFVDEAWIKNGVPYFCPVYACCNMYIEEMSMNDHLNISWVDDRYEGMEGTVIVGISTEKNRKFGSSVGFQTIVLIRVNNNLIIESNGSFFEMEKVGEVKMYNTFINIEQ